MPRSSVLKGSIQNASNKHCWVARTQNFKLTEQGLKLSFDCLIEVFFQRNGFQEKHFSFSCDDLEKLTNVQLKEILRGLGLKVTGAAADIDDLKKVQTSNGNSFILFWDSFEKGKDQDKDRASASTTFAVSSWFCVHVQCCALVNVESKDS